MGSASTGAGARAPTARLLPRPRLTVSHAGPSIPRIDACSDAILEIEALRFRAIDGNTIPPQQDVQPPIAEPTTLTSKLAQPRPQILVTVTTRAVAHARPVGPDHGAGASLAQLTGKEQRSAVSQVVQGTASLIFKRALMAAVSLNDVRIVLPMHDALLFEHRAAGTPARVVEAFEATMTDVLGGSVTGKASVGGFAAS